MESNKKIVVVGAGYVGTPLAAVLASKNKDHKLTVLDNNSDLVAKWNRGENPIKEPALTQIVSQRINKNLFFTSDGEAYSAADIVFLAVPTPSKSHSYQHDLRYVEEATRTLAKVCARQKMSKRLILVEKSTVPVRTCIRLRQIFKEEQILHPQNIQMLEVLSNPQFLVVGRAVENVLQPDRVIIGGECAEELVKLYEGWVPRQKIITSSVFSAELAKVASNAFLAQRISSINSLTPVCQKLGCDIGELGTMVGSDPRIGKNYLQAGLGFGGSCLRKDLLSLVYLCQSLDLKEVAEYWRAVDRLNNYQQERFVERIAKQVRLQGARLAILGFAFKKGTSDCRNTLAATVCSQLLQGGAQLQCYDPMAPPEVFIQELKLVGRWNHTFEQKVRFQKTANQCIAGCIAAVVLVDWDQFLELRMEGRQLQWVFDGKCCLDTGRLREAGLRCYRIGS